MKSTDFKRSGSKIRILEEIRPAKKKVNWDRLIYLGILIFLALFGVFTIVRSNLYVKGEGQVLFKKLDIQFTQDIQIIDFLKREGDEVEVGDTLFYYYDEHTINKAGSGIQEYTVQVLTNDNLDWIIRERLSTEKKIEISRIAISEQEQLRDKLKQEESRLTKEVYLDVYPVAKLQAYRDELLRIDNRLLSLAEEVKYHRRYLQYLAAQESAEIEKEKILAAMDPALQPIQLYPYISPVKGLITQISKENYEVALESDVIMSIHKPTNLYIRAFYDQGDLKHLQQGDVVDVEFPDGTHSYGILQRFYFATYQLPDEFQKKYEPTTRSIAADITPIDELELEKWRPFYKLNVHISKAKDLF